MSPSTPTLRNPILTFCQTAINHVQQEEEQHPGAAAHGLNFPLSDLHVGRHRMETGETAWGGRRERGMGGREGGREGQEGGEKGESEREGGNEEGRTVNSRHSVAAG